VGQIGSPAFREMVMRRLRYVGAGCALGLMAATGLATPASAADYSLLRGSQYEPAPAPQSMSTTTTTGGANWEGFYVLGHTNYNGLTSDFGSAGTRALSNAYAGSLTPPQNVLDGLRMGKKGDDNKGFGFSVGYNMMLDDVMLGVEVDYAKSPLQTSTSASFATTVANVVQSTRTQSLAYEAGGTETDFFGNGSAKFSLKDVVMGRVRVGYASGNFMPYLTFGAAVARYNSMVSVGQSNISYNIGQDFNLNTVFGLSGPVQMRGAPVNSFGRRTPAIAPDSGSSLSIKSGYVPGLTIGLGMDALVFNNIMLRAEYQRTYFADVDAIKVTLDQARVSAGLKF
jgi:hypothetical protein